MDIDAYATVDKELAKIPYCSSKCNYYTVCPVCDRTDSELAACALRMLEESQRRRFVNLYLLGREGLKAESTELLFNLARSLNLKSNPGDMITYIDTILKIDRSFKVEAKKGAKETEEPPTKVEVSISKKAAPKDPVEKIVRAAERDLDDNPESLYNSPVLENIAGFKLPNDKKVVSIQLDPVPCER